MGIMKLNINPNTELLYTYIPQKYLNYCKYSIHYNREAINNYRPTVIIRRATRAEKCWIDYAPQL